MNVTLYKYYSEKNRIVKSVTGEFKADTSILSPAFPLSDYEAIPTPNHFRSMLGYVKLIGR